MLFMKPVTEFLLIATNKSNFVLFTSLLGKLKLKTQLVCDATKGNDSLGTSHRVSNYLKHNKGSVYLEAKIKKRTEGDI